MRGITPWMAFGLSILVCACSNDRLSGESNESKSGEDSSAYSARVIYGNDDRKDLFDMVGTLWHNKAESTVALIQSSRVKVDAVNGGYTLTTSKYGASQSLCASEPFYDQVTSAFCSGSLIGPDLVMTAGHCIRSASACQSTKFVFNFAYKNQGQDPKSVGEDDVYSCAQLIHSELNNSNMNDYAIVRLDRPVVGRAPLAIRQSGAISQGDELVVIGHPSGLPTKIAGGAMVRDNTPEFYFVSNLDTYGGNSGSAVFNKNTGVVEGILVRGATDFKYQSGCYVSNVCADDGCRGEDVTRVTEVLKHVDASDLAPLPPFIVDAISL